MAVAPALAAAGAASAVIDTRTLTAAQRAALSGSLRHGDPAPARALAAPAPAPSLAPSTAPRNPAPRSPRTPASSAPSGLGRAAGAAVRGGPSGIVTRLIWALALGLLTLEVISQMTGRYFDYTFGAPRPTNQPRSYKPLFATPAYFSNADPRGQLTPLTATGTPLERG